MLRKTKNSEKGFTIIEVMIVLAIAGLILLIVFLAVPALQRNARNTQRKNDASAILSAVTEYGDNNGGAVPTNDTFTAGTGTLTLCTGTNCTGTDAQTKSKLGYYKAVALKTSYTTPGTAADTITIYENAICSSATAATATGASTRSFVALYGVEASGKFVWQCVGS